MLRYPVGLVILGTVAAFSAVSQTVSDRNADYVGSDTCRNCHLEIYEDYSQSGHPRKIQKVEGAPPIFASDTSPGVPSPPADKTWSDISYVIGGFHWKARFMDQDGYILTGPQNRQYNLANDTLGLGAHWGAYDAESAPRKPYTCGACHTTGWVETGPEGPHQDGLPGIHGVWAEPGVTCEACHGPGAAHAANPAAQSLSREPNCAACHIRGDVTRIDASDGLIRHHEQYEDLLASPHKDLGCMTCHDPHKSAKYGRAGYKGQETTCLTCHAAQSPVSVAADAHDDCTSCHMPLAGKSAVSKIIAFQGGSLPKGDIRSHIFRIADDPDWKMFTEDGKFVAIDDQRRAFLTVEYTCLSCHQDRDGDWALVNAPLIHGKR
jgi:hypothetical protein